MSRRDIAKIINELSTRSRQQKNANREAQRKGAFTGPDAWALQTVKAQLTLLQTVQAHRRRKIHSYVLVGGMSPTESYRNQAKWLSDALSHARANCYFESWPEVYAEIVVISILPFEREPPQETAAG